ncbi:FixH family protein [Sulfurospirillum sp. 1307]|jgi:hypothetical protein
MNKAKERNYWPHGIVMVLLFMVFACVMVVKISMDNPVQMDSFYLEKYQQVDENINAIKEAQVKFEKNYNLIYKTNKFKIGSNNSFEMSIKDIKSDKLIQNANITLVVTRPDVNDYNKEFKLTSAKNGIFKFDNIQVELPGRWQILTKIKIGDLSSFNKYEVYATK